MIMHKPAINNHEPAKNADWERFWRLVMDADALISDRRETEAQAAEEAAQTLKQENPLRANAEGFLTT